MTLNDFWIWVYGALGSSAARKLLSVYGNPLAACKAGRSEWVSSGIITEGEMEKAILRMKPEQAQYTAALCEKKHWNIILPGGEYYPELLRQIKKYPVILFADGDKTVLTGKTMIASVGTRNSSARGEFLAYSLCKALARAGAVVVSGGAFGIDTVSHTGAIDGGGKTVAVLGCGFGCNYLSANEKLRKRIAENGALLTEYLPNEGATPYHFPERNRIISGMCSATVVTQAAEKSGSLITAGCAMEQGRTVFAFPVDSHIEGFSGNDILFKKGAHPIISAGDIFSENTPEGIDTASPEVHRNLLMAMNTEITEQKPDDAQVMSRKKTPAAAKAARETVEPTAAEPCEPVKQPVPPELGELAKRLYEHIGTQAVIADDAAIKAGLNGGELMCALTELEVAGIVRQLPGNRCVAV